MTRYKINMEKSMALIYTYINNNQLEDIIIEKPIFIKATKKITCLNKKPKRKCGKKSMCGKL